MADPGVGFDYSNYNSAPTVAANSSRADSKLTISANLSFAHVSESEDIHEVVDTQAKRDQDTNWSEGLNAREELLDEACRKLIKDAAACALAREAKGTPLEHNERLREAAYEMWDKACNVPEETRCLIIAARDAELKLWFENVAFAKMNYARAAGSSLNSLVQGWHLYDLDILAERLTAIQAKYGVEAIQIRGQQLAAAYDAKVKVHHDFFNSEASKAINLVQVLKGSLSMSDRDTRRAERVDTRDHQVVNRTFDRSLSRNTTAFALNGEWYQMVIDSSETQGTYGGMLGQVVASGASLAFPSMPSIFG